MESRKMVLMKLFAGQQWRCRVMDMGAGGGRRRKEKVEYMERVTWKLTLPCGKQTANRNLLYDSGNSNQSSLTT